MPREHVESSLFKMLETYLSNFYALSTPTLSSEGWTWAPPKVPFSLSCSVTLWVLQSSWSGTRLWFGWWFLPPSVNASNLSNKTVFIFLRQQCCPSGFAQTLLNLGTSQGLVLVENLSLHMLSVRLLMTFFFLYCYGWWGNSCLWWHCALLWALYLTLVHIKMQNAQSGLLRVHWLFSRSWTEY